MTVTNYFKVARHAFFFHDKDEASVRHAWEQATLRQALATTVSVTHQRHVPPIAVWTRPLHGGPWIEQAVSIGNTP